MEPFVENHLKEDPMLIQQAKNTTGNVFYITYGL